VPVGFDQSFYNVSDRGYLAENFPGYLVTNSSLIPTAGRYEMVRLKVPQAGLCTNIVLHLNTPGSGLTAGQNFAALYYAGPAQAVIAQSVDQSTNWATGGNRSCQLNGGPYYLHAGEYYAIFWWNGGTAPSVSRMASIAAGAANGNTTAPNFLYAFNAAGLTTAAPATLGTQSANGTTWWVGLS